MRPRTVSLALLVAAAGCRAPPTTSTTVVTSGDLAGRHQVYERWKVTFDAATNGRDPDDITVEGTFTTPSGATVRAEGFPSGGHFEVRYTPREVGVHRWVVRSAEGVVARGAIEAVSSSRRGFVRVDPEHRQRLVADDGTTTFILGESRSDFDVVARDHLGVRSWVERMASYGVSTLRVFVPTSLEPHPGRFDEPVAESFDVLFDAAEKSNVDIVLVAFARRGWNEHPFSAGRGHARAPKDFFLDPIARAGAIRRLRYISARWGSSPRLLALDLLDEPERDGAIRERVWIPWAEALSSAWHSLDPYGHLVTAGPVGLHWNVEEDERPWYASASNDLVQWHLFGDEVRDAQALAAATTQKLRETDDLDKPVFCGAFGDGLEDRSTFDHTHVGIWSLAMSGAGALASTPPPLPMAAARARHFAVLSTFLRSLDPRRAYSPRSDVRLVSPLDGTRIWSLSTDDRMDRVLWLLAPSEGYATATSRTLAINAPRGARFRVSWIDDTTGRHVPHEPEHLAATDDDTLIVSVPPFARHIAARITHE
jgi:hypothetical protein